MAVRRLELTNMNDDSRFLLCMQSVYSQSVQGWKNTLAEAFEEAGINMDDLGELTGLLPDGDKIDLSAGDWGTLSALMIETGMGDYLSYPTSAGGGNYTLQVNTQYKHANGRYMKVERSVDNEHMRFVVYDTDDSVIYTGNYFKATRFLYYLCCPAEVKANDTISDFRAGCGQVQILMYVSPNVEPVEPTSFTVYGSSPNDPATFYKTDWIYYLLHDPNQDVPIPEPPSPGPGVDPYDPYGPSGPNPGTDDPDDPYDPGDPINPPGLPGWDPSDSGFLKIFIPSSTVLHLLCAKLWDSNFFTTMLRQFIADPRDAIISLGCVPFNVTPSGSAEIKVGDIGTEITSAYVSSPYIDIDCGSVQIKPILNGYTDYSPYTQMYLYLPYVGTVQLDTDVYMNKTVQVKYRCDILTGDCLAYVLVAGQVKAVYNGNLLFSIPITSADYSQMWNTFLSVTTGVVMGSLGAASAAAAKKKEITNAAIVDAGLQKGLGNLAESQGIKPQIQISGQLQSTNGLLGPQKPFIEIRRPNLCIPDGQKTIEGYPSLVTGRLSAFSGYTEVEEIHLAIPGATKEEIEEIKLTLMGGVIL